MVLRILYLWLVYTSSYMVGRKFLSYRQSLRHKTSGKTVGKKFCQTLGEITDRKRIGKWLAPSTKISKMNERSHSDTSCDCVDFRHFLSWLKWGCLIKPNGISRFNWGVREVSETYIRTAKKIQRNVTFFPCRILVMREMKVGKTHR